MTSTDILVNQSSTFNGVALKPYSVFNFNNRAKWNVATSNKCTRKASTDSCDTAATTDDSVDYSANGSRSSFSPSSGTPRSNWETKTAASEDQDDSIILNSAMKPKKKAVADETKYKTELCKKYVEHGYCPYGKKCKFAHGKQELNEKFLSNKRRYKSKKCNSFHTTMSCPYGSRCLFAHEQRNVEELQADCFYEKFMFCPEVLSTITERKRLPCFGNAIDNEAKEESSCLNLSSFEEDDEEFSYILQIASQ